MKYYELLEEHARVLRLCEGTKVNWNAGIRHKNSLGWYTLYTTAPLNPDEMYRFAVAIVEDKFVFLGDELYAGNGQKFTVGDDYKMILKSDWAKCSWNPPKPTTIMVEMELSDVRYIANTGAISIPCFNACRKAIKEMK